MDDIERILWESMTKDGMAELRYMCEEAGTTPEEFMKQVADGIRGEVRDNLQGYAHAIEGEAQWTLKTVAEHNGLLETEALQQLLFESRERQDEMMEAAKEGVKRERDEFNKFLSGEE